jgi:hypothetical protein
MVGGLLVAASFAAVNPDIGLSRGDQDSKQAYAAAESGLQWYLNGLARDNNYYLYCYNPPAPNASEVAPVNPPYTSGSFKWRNLPGEQAKYGVELMSAPGYSSCSPSNQYSVVDAYGNLRLRVTGRSRNKTRSILATLRRRNFIDFIYFTHFETLDPAAYSDVATATTRCAKFRDQRTSYCTEIQFANDDDVLGPFHTNDNILVCGSPQFGRSKRDAVEINGNSSYVSACSGTNPNWAGTLTWPAGQLEMPPSNSQLATLATSSYQFDGRTEIVLNGTTMSVKNPRRWSDNQFHSMSLPTNGVIYVNNVSCTGGYDRTMDYSTEEANCGNAWVKGNYGRDLTIGADNDIVINGNLQRANDGLLMGLIANNFVRVYHPVNRGSSCTNLTGSTSDITIQAAILALQHSFIVDNWDCGASLGRLNVEGAIAQRFRGPVGTTGGTGYLKNYVYNDRLRYREPPYFLDPVQASWRISRQNEQLPAAKVP